MIDTCDYASLFLHDVPMIDTRAPVEFARGSFPAAVNLPLMTDDERALVGTCYKQQGQQAAIELGHELVQGETKETRVANWLAFARDNPAGCLFCFRGGLRSQICQEWLRDAGCDFPRVTGGYKAMRRFLLDTLERECRRRQFILLGGHTGAAKTALLLHIANSLDLEGIAHHRGSAFGKRPGGQPPQIGFENAIAIGLLKHAHNFPSSACVLEDESRMIGQRHLPEMLGDAMARAPLVLVESSLEERVEHTFENYILDALSERQACYGADEGFEDFSDYLRQSLYNIRRRLGGERYNTLQTVLTNALDAHRCGDPGGHRVWIEILLRDYYDPMYSYQLKQKQDRVIFAGESVEVLEYLQKENLHAEMA